MLSVSKETTHTMSSTPLQITLSKQIITEKVPLDSQQKITSETQQDWLIIFESLQRELAELAEAEVSGKRLERTKVRTNEKSVVHSNLCPL